LDTWLFNKKSFLQLETIHDYSLTQKLLETEQSDFEYLVLTKEKKKNKTNTKQKIRRVGLFSFPFPFFHVGMNSFMAYTFEISLGSSLCSSKEA